MPTFSKIRSINGPIISIVFMGFLLRIVMFAVVAGHMERASTNPDTAGYMTTVSNFLSSGGILTPDNGKRTPIYPLLIAAIYATGGENLYLLMFIQVLIGTLEIFLTYKLGSRILPKNVALIGAAFIAVGFESITYVAYFLTEGLFTFLLLASVFFWVKAQQESKTLWFVTGAIFMGITALCRPIALYFPLVLTLIFLFQTRLKGKGRIASACLYLLCFLMTVIPWVIRNYMVIGVPTVTTVSTYNLLYYNAQSLEADLRGVGEEQIQNELHQRVEQTLKEKGWEPTIANRIKVEKMIGRQIIFAHPVRYLYLHLKDDLKSLLPDVTNFLELLGVTTGGKGTRLVLNEHGLVAAVRNYFGDSAGLLLAIIPLILFVGGIFILDLIGFMSLLKVPNWFPLTLLTVTAVYFLLIPGAPSVPRFRVPVMPYLSLLAAVGAVSLHHSHGDWSIRRKQ